MLLIQLKKCFTYFLFEPKEQEYAVFRFVYIITINIKDQLFTFDLVFIFRIFIKIFFIYNICMYELYLLLKMD